MFDSIHNAILLFTIFANIILLIMFFIFWYNYREKNNDLKFFLIFIFFIIIALVGLSLILNLPIMSIIIYLSSIIAYCFLYYGFVKFFNKNISKISINIIIILYTALLIFYIYINPNLFLVEYMTTICNFLIVAKIIYLICKSKLNMKGILLIPFCLEGIVLLIISILVFFPEWYNNSTIIYKLIEIILLLNKINITLLIFLVLYKQKKSYSYIGLEIFEKIFEQSSEGIAIESLDGSLLKVNNKFCKILGYNNLELTNLTYMSITHPDDLTASIKFLKSLENSNIANHDNIIEKRYIKKDGSIIWVMVSCSLVRDINNQPQYFVTNIIDITERKEMEAKRLEIETNLHKAKLEAENVSQAKSEFLAVISHEVRTPLTTILGLLQLLRNTILNEKQLNYLKKIHTAGNSLLNIVNDMLNIAKFESGKLDIENLPFDFVSFIENIITINKLKAESNDHIFNYDIGKDIPRNLIGDSLRLYQILDNIISNAIKFTHKGTIGISVRLEGRSPNSADLEFIIRDTGIGMTPEQVDKLFEPFMQADTSFTRKYGGTGLGMAISKQLIELMGGKIEVDSIHGEGTIFIISLNLTIADQNAITSDSFLEKEIMKSKPENIKGKKVLIVEDHEINQEILRDILAYYELNIDVANNGTEALAKISKTYYDLIFMDIQMPVMDGLTATRKVREMEDIRKKHVPILAMTAHAMQEEFQKSFDAGMNDHLTKPIDINKLEEVLIKYLSKVETSYVSKIQNYVQTDIQVVDIRMGLIRFHYDAESYKHSLIKFYKYKNADVQIKEMINEGDIAEAIRLSHSIKGIAANLSINRLSKSAHNLKEILSSHSNISNELKDFSDNLKLVIGSIEDEKLIKRIDIVKDSHFKI